MKLSINYAVLVRNGNILNRKRKFTKENPSKVPLFETYTKVLTVISTHLGFRWTLPFNGCITNDSKLTGGPH
jgi:hypothetical protein